VSGLICRRGGGSSEKNRKETKEDDIQEGEKSLNTNKQFLSINRGEAVGLRIVEEKYATLCHH
jgi:hypothetical protein